MTIRPTTAKRIKNGQADRTDGAIMLYAVNCLYKRNASPKKTDNNLMKFNKSKKIKRSPVKVYRAKVD